MLDDVLVHCDRIPETRSALQLCGKRWFVVLC